MIRWFAVGIVLSSAGCDQVFGLHRDDAADAPADIAKLDAALDAPACVAPTTDDEDGDGVPDACDNCPQVAQTSFDDDDQDGVGNACDPDPGRRDTQLAFFGFNAPTPALSLRVDPGPGTWTMQNGSLVLANAVADGDYLAFFDAGQRDVIVDTAVTLVAAGSDLLGHSQSIGLWTDIDATSPDPTFPAGMVYELVGVQPMNFAHITETSHVPLNTIESSPAAALFAVGKRYRLRFACQGQTTPACVGSVTYDVNDTTVTIALASGTTRTGGVGLRVHGDVTPSFDYLVVYGGPQ